MRKHESLRAALVEALPVLAREKDRLAVWIDRGNIAARLGTRDAAGNTGFEYRYRLTAILIDFADDPAKVFAATIDWLRTAQPEILLNPQSLQEAVTFEVDVLDDRKVDIQLQVELTEAVDIGPQGAITYREEPPLDEGFIDVPAGTTLDEIAIDGAPPPEAP